MGQVAGYTVADYLIQHASRERRYARVPASTWDAILSHIRDPADTARLADSARNRLLYRYAIPLYRHAADAGDGTAARRLADLLAERGDLDGPRRSCAPGPTPATGLPPGGWPSCWPSAATWTGCAPGPTPATGTPPRRLAELLAERGDLDGRSLRARADAGDRIAARRLAELLAERGDLDGLRARADAGDGLAAGRLADLLAERGDLDGAAQILRARADAGDGDCRRAAGRPAGRARRPGRAGRSARPGRRRRHGTPPGGWPTCWPSAATSTGPTDPARPGRRRRRGRRPAAGRSAGRARRPGRAARPGRRRRQARRPAAGRAAGRARRPGRAARPGRRRRLARRRAAGRAAGRARRPGRAARPGRRRRRGLPPGGWPSC